MMDGWMETRSLGVRTICKQAQALVNAETLLLPTLRVALPESTFIE